MAEDLSENATQQLEKLGVHIRIGTPVKDIRRGEVELDLRLFRWEGSTPVKTQVLTLSITFDHRAVDGAPAAEYLRSVVSRLAPPLSLLA